MCEKKGNFASAFGATLVLQAQKAPQAHLISGFSLACTYLPLFSEGWVNATCLFNLDFPLTVVIISDLEILSTDMNQKSCLPEMEKETPKRSKIFN